MSLIHFLSLCFSVLFFFFPFFGDFFRNSFQFTLKKKKVPVVNFNLSILNFLYFKKMYWSSLIGSFSYLPIIFEFLVLVFWFLDFILYYSDNFYLVVLLKFLNLILRFARPADIHLSVFCTFGWWAYSLKGFIL
jgi:hypothetical protein